MENRLDVARALKYLGFSITESISGRYPDLVTKDQWDAWTWPFGGTKPVFSAAMTAAGNQAVEDKRLNLYSVMRGECQRAITRIAYGQASFQDEVIYRLNQRNTPEQDALRKKILSVYRQWIDWIGRASLQEIDDFNPLGRDVWPDSLA